MRILPRILVLIFGTVFLLGVILHFFLPRTSITLGNMVKANACSLIKSSLSVNDYHINFYKSKNKNSKDTLVLIHGLADNKASFLKTAKYLSEDYFLVIPDLIGHGQNVKDKKINYSFSSQASYLKKLLDTLGLKKYHIAGISTGGIVGMYLSKKHPSFVRSLTLINTPYLNNEENKFYQPFGQSVKNDQELERVFGLFFSQPPALSNSLKNFYRNQIDSDFNFTHKIIIPDIKENLIKDKETWISSIKIPVLILHSTNDHYVDIQHALKYDQILPNSTYGTIKETGHYAHYEKPYLVSASVQGQLKRNSLLH